MGLLDSGQTQTAMKPLGITETIFRDAHQSLLATRMRTEDMLSVAAKVDKVGYHSVECWGGATFDSAMRFLDEDPWERLRALRRAMPNTRTQMLLRGQNVVGYRHYADDIVERFIVLARRNGMDVFRIFDALNNVEGAAWAIKVAKREGGHVQGGILYTTSPAHTVDGFVRLACEFAELGADSICIKDMAGLINPYDAYELVRRLKKEVPLPLQFHAHHTSGMGTAATLKAVEAGADVVDTAISPLSMSTSQPPTETVVSMLKGTPRDTGLDLGQLAEIAEQVTEIRKKYSRYETGLFGVDVNVLQFQVPGGMLSNLVAQLREQGAEGRYREVLAEVIRVRAELGYPPLATPSSQIVGTQATLNVIVGERYKVVPREVRDYVRGMYGKPPAPIDPRVQRLVLGDEKPIDCRPADLIQPEYERAKQEAGDLAHSEEDIISYALFPQVARTFLERRARGGSAAEERVAAVAAVLAGIRQAPLVADRPALRLISPWRMAGRHAAFGYGRRGGR